MRIIKHSHHIIRLANYHIIDEETKEYLKRFFSYNKDEANVVMLEIGDNLKTLGVFGIDKNTNGIIGINYETIDRTGNIICFTYKYDNLLYNLVFREEICDKETLDFIELFRN